MMRSAWISIFTSIALAACGSATPAPAAAPDAPSASTSATASPTPAPKGTASSEPAPNLCGCSLCAPVVSNDTCATDADCAPSTPCHATVCVAKAKAKPKTPDTMCTMMMNCQSADANRCGCHQGRCALVPREDRGG